MYVHVIPVSQKFGVQRVSHSFVLFLDLYDVSESSEAQKLHSPAIYGLNKRTSLWQGKSSCCNQPLAQRLRVQQL